MGSGLPQHSSPYSSSSFLGGGASLSFRTLKPLGTQTSPALQVKAVPGLSVKRIRSLPQEPEEPQEGLS